MSHSAEGHHGHHIIPFKTLATVFGALVFLTLLTVFTAKAIDFGFLEVPVAMAIATTKAALVVVIFMGLKWDNKVNVLAFCIGSIFVFVFLGITLLDTAFRGDASNVDKLTIIEQQMQLDALEGREPDPADLRIAPGDYAVGTAANEEADAASEDAATDAEAASDEAEGTAPDTE